MSREYNSYVIDKKTAPEPFLIPGLFFYYFYFCKRFTLDEGCKILPRVI